MAKYDRHMEAAAEVDIDLSELFKSLGNRREKISDRQQAIACFLSGSDGWRQAAGHLGGSFTDPAEKDLGLTRSKD